MSSVAQPLLTPVSERPVIRCVPGLTGAELRRRLRPIEPRSLFMMDDWCVWCGTATITPDGVSHLLFSRWPRARGHAAWVTHSEIAYATATDPTGPYTFQHVALAGAGGSAWDADVTHNPTLLEHEGKYYLYYMGNHGNGEYWNHRNHQRVGVAVADHPAGPWKRFDKPLIDITPGAFDGKLTSNPTVTRGPDGRFCMIYKAVSPKGVAPKYGAVVCGVAFADHPLGPFVKQPAPIMVNPENEWSVEDPFVWCQDGRYYCIVKDFQGYFARTEQCVLVLFESPDGISWNPTHDPLVITRDLAWSDGTRQRVEAIERPQLLMRDGKPIALLLAYAPQLDRLISGVLQMRIDND
jgi:hypothetical protein